MSHRKRGLPPLVGPMLHYDLVRSLRKTRHYVFRFLYCFAVLCVFAWAYETFFSRMAFLYTRSQIAVQFGAYFFATFASVHVTATLVLAATLLGGAIADERQRKTLDFMFVTDLSAREIVLGKLAARALLTASLLVAPLPILMCVVLFGSVSPEWIAQLAVLTASSLFCFGAFSAYLSVISERPRDSVSRAIMLIAVCMGCPPLTLLFARGFGFTGWYLEPLVWLEEINPYLFLVKQFGRAIEASWDALWVIAFWHGVVGLAFTFLSVWRVRGTVVAPVWGVAAAPSSRDVGLRRRRPAIGAWPPIAWRELFVEPAVRIRGRVGRMLALFGYLGIFAFVIWMFLRNVVFGDSQYRYGMYSPEAYVMGVSLLSMAFGIGLLLMCGARAATAVTSEREADTWTTLIAGPIDGAAIFWGKFLGALGGFRHLLWPLVFAWALVYFANAREMWRGPATLLVVLVIASFNATLGLYFSVSSKSSRGASVKTVLTILTLFGGYLMVVAPLMSGSRESAILLAPCQTFLIGMVSFAGLDGPAGPPTEIMNAFVFGVSMYAFGTFVLSMMVAASFDGLAGRCVTRVAPDSPAAPRPVAKERAAEPSAAAS